MIRQAKSDDLSAIANVHKKCFIENFSTVLGVKFNLLEKFYSEYLLKTPELFIVAENDDHQVVGFCMGYYCESNDYMKNYFKHNLIAIGLRMSFLLATGNKIAWRKIYGNKQTDKWEIKNSEFDIIPVCERGDLLSICVLPEYRGAGVSQDLMEEYLNILKSHNRKLCLLSVDPKNQRAIRFYEKNGFTLYKQCGERTASYAKLL